MKILFNQDELKLEWVYFDAQANLNPTYTKTYIRDINCQKSSNLIYLDEKNIYFGSNYHFDFIDSDLSYSTMSSFHFFSLFLKTYKILTNF
jgi:hypothetical protein